MPVRAPEQTSLPVPKGDRRQPTTGGGLPQCRRTDHPTDSSGRHPSPGCGQRPGAGPASPRGSRSPAAFGHRLRRAGGQVDVLLRRRPRDRAGGGAAGRRSPGMRPGVAPDLRRAEKDGRRGPPAAPDSAALRARSWPATTPAVTVLVVDNDPDDRLRRRRGRRGHLSGTSGEPCQARSSQPGPARGTTGIVAFVPTTTPSPTRAGVPDRGGSPPIRSSLA
ncbi:hypothetical protein HBB16_16270 [Pseudonocardia sp. MCCB 268]|nr:hypothetical protein [Pseudonocardia cytotoxica]